MDLEKGSIRNTAYLLSLGFLVFIVAYTFGRHSEINWKFKGVVEKVHYDYQGYPTVKVNNKTYYLS